MRAGRRPQPHLVIGVVFAAFLAGEALILDVQPGPRWLAVVLAVGLGLVFVAQPRAPLLVALGAHVFIQARIGFDVIPAASYAYIMALPLMFFGVGAYGPARGRLVRFAVLLAITLGARGAWLQWHLDAAPTTHEAMAYWTFYTALTVLGFGLGLIVRDRSAAVERLGQRVERLEATLDDRAAEAVAAEQRRVSGDIRHLVSELVARVDGVLGQAEAIAGSDPGRAETLLAAAGDSARRAMERMRETLGRLRADAGPARTVHPGAASVEDLVGTLERAGARVAVEGRSRSDVPEVLVLAADRIAAAAPALLTTPPTQARLRLTADALELELRAPRHRRWRRPAALVAASAPSARTAAAATAAPRRTSGTALAEAVGVALVERVRLLGGELHVHQRRGRLTARLPFDAAPLAPAPSAWTRLRRLRPPVRPEIAAGVVFVIGLGLADQLGYADAPGPLAERLLLAIALPLPLLLSGRWPLPSALAVQVVLVAGSAHETFGGLACEGTVVSLLCAFVFGVQPWPLWRSLGFAVVVMAAASLGMLVEEFAWPLQSYLAYMAMLAGTWGAGRLVRGRLAAAEVVRAQLGDLQARRRAAAARAAAQERARLAREIHDVVGHAVAVVCIQAGVGERLAATHKPDGARDAIVAARGAAATAARELDRLGDLLPDEEGPGLPDLPALVERLRTGGMQVELRLVAAEPVAPDVGSAAYRVVQEALTNAAKHAADAPVLVTVTARDGELRVQVRNGAGRSLGSPGGGHGLPGMRDRVAEHGGTLRAGPRGDDAWEVTATFPLAAVAV